MLVQEVLKNPHQIPRHFSQLLQPSTLCSASQIIYLLFHLAFELISSLFQKNLKALHLPKDFFPVAIALTTKWPRILFLKTFRLLLSTWFIYLCWFKWFTQPHLAPIKSWYQEHQSLHLAPLAEHDSISTRNHISGTKLLPLQRSQCFPWHSNCSNPKRLPIPSSVGIRGQCSTVPTPLSIHTPSGWGWTNTTTEPYTSSPGKEETFPQKEQHNIHFYIHNRRAPLAQLILKRLIEDYLRKYCKVLPWNSKKKIKRDKKNP